MNTETIDRLPGMQEEDLRRKIPVDHLEYRSSPIFFDVVFHPDSIRTYRKEFAELRKEMKIYRQNHLKDITARFLGTTGNRWHLHKDLLAQFADLIEIREPLETIVARTIQEGEAEQERKRQEEKERRRQWHQDLRAHRIPCPSPCKVRVSRLEGIKGGDALDFFCRDKDEPSLHHFRLQLNEGETQQEKDARIHLSKTLLEDKENRTTGIRHRTNNIQGCGLNWELHEYVLLAYSEWLELEEDIETLIAREEEKIKQEAEAEYARWEKEYLSASRGNRASELDTSLTLFNLDTSATQDDVKKRYRALSKLYHPDTGGNEEEFKRLNQANQVLCSILHSGS